MPPKYFYYYKPKVFLVTVFLLLLVAGLTFAAIAASDTPVRIICILVLVPMAIVCYFGIADGFIPSIQNKAVLIVDEDGITDVISWGLIKWSNIKELAPANGGGRYHSFTEMHITLKDLNSYEFYRDSRWIRFKIKFIKIYKGIPVDIVIDIDALKGKASYIFNVIDESYKNYKNQ